MSVNHEVLPEDRQSIPEDELAEYFIQFREDEINKINPKSVFFIDINEHQILKSVLEEERTNFKPIVRRALIKAIQFYRTDDEFKREKLAEVFNDIKINITIPVNTTIENLKSSVHEDKIVTFKAEIGTITKPETVSLSSDYYCDECDLTLPVRNLQLIKCMSCGKKMQFVKVTKSEDIQRISLRQSLIDSKVGLKFTLKEIEADLHNGFVNRVRLGESAIITGVYKSVPLGKKKGNLQHTNLPIIDVINVETYDDTIEDLPTYDEMTKFRELLSNNRMTSLLTQSYAYHIYGKEKEKFCVLLALLNGAYAKMSRDRLHVFFVGDPSSAKSEIAKYAIRVSHKSRYTDGTGSSKAGLLAGYVTLADGRPAISPGPVVKCDLGHVVVDEFEKMKKEDMVGMLQFMEEGIVNRSLAGEDFSANARTTLIATANPLGGKWDDKHPSVADNISIPIYIFSRFDLKVKVMKEKTREERQKVMDWMKTTKNGKLDWMLSDDEIRRFLNYARKLQPIMSNDAEKIIDEYYHKLNDLGEQHDTIAIDWRNYGALKRIATAIAKIYWKQEIDAKCALEAIELYEYTLSTFGLSVDQGMTEASKPMKDTKKGKEQAFVQSCQELSRESEDGLFFESALIDKLKSYDGLFENDETLIKTFIREQKIHKRLIERYGQLKYTL